MRHFAESVSMATPPATLQTGRPSRMVGVNSNFPR